MPRTKKDEALTVYQRLEQEQLDDTGSSPSDSRGAARKASGKILKFIVQRVADVDPEAADHRVKELWAKNPHASATELVEQLIRAKCIKTASIAAATSAPAAIPGIGTLLSLTAGMAVDFSSTLKLHTELVLEIARAYGKTLDDSERSEVILAVTGISTGVGQIGRQAAMGLSARTGELATRKWLTKALPVVGVAASASTSVLATYLIGRRAVSYFKRGPESMGSWKDSLRALSGVDEQKIAAWVAESTGSLGRAMTQSGKAVLNTGSRSIATAVGGAGTAASLAADAGKAASKVLAAGVSRALGLFPRRAPPPMPHTGHNHKLKGAGEIIQKALDCGASLAGIASVEALAASRSYAGHVSIACPVQGHSLLVLALAQDAAWAEFDWWDRRPGGTPGNRRMVAIMDQVVAWLGEHGHVAARVLPYNLEKGGVFLKGAAVLAGLGCVGRNNLLITRDFGPCVRLRAILVGQELASTGPGGRDFCVGCDVPCRRVCPQNAFESGAFDRSRCSLQMRKDRLEGSAGRDARRAPFADIPVKSCRACELACPQVKT